MSRRGGGSVALSRQHRTMGSAKWEEALLPIIETAIAPHHLVLDAPALSATPISPQPALKRTRSSGNLRSSLACSRLLWMAT